ncbi:histone deacetylase family protein [Primorskyibacter aestuariivivens]|uniref:histone deacetylase family protein n=1 Tax=Primorskyibacter aestuariivivens TaxID=1888912 RepID=UPI0022FFEFD9|nr:histone deacetylase family protein [Primorskyibacter aestuariivivens]MDA7429916.1 histone deacetylase family protein [Primorskyibacter aestuariivivens]
MSTLILTHEACLNHVTPEGHPERVARLEHVLHALRQEGIGFETAPMGAREDVLLCHPESYVERLETALPDEGFFQLDGDTWMSPGSLGAAWRGVGAVREAVDRVIAGDAGNAFCATRPPGHHAEQETPMGFCLFGNVAIGAKHALERHGLSRVAVVDFDVHHGNGTQALLWDEPRALFCTSQQMPLWPGSGHPSETGAHDNILNVPLDPGSPGVEMRTAYEAQIFPRLHAFKPEMLFISAGFDAHRADPLAQLKWVEDDFAWLTQELCAIASEHCGGRVVSVMEGGYDLGALAASVVVHVKALQEAAA